ncbi:hypothetical protein [Candidatus Cytomitobacter primus]|uniref:Uncharacterized protein n=1 Tax=Candidatus Cytomitobacter primus TaxID=2066024 RepID=A0A5C0UFP0_9PROT|nr:hypothetical protein [Candidatus Cytomitobacter primus]QEK38537.1 hypothetical protein FZC34_01270 [Candidatus Cytomitobacter primus]
MKYNNKFILSIAMACSINADQVSDMAFLRHVVEVDMFKHVSKKEYTDKQNAFLANSDANEVSAIMINEGGRSVYIENNGSDAYLVPNTIQLSYHTNHLPLTPDQINLIKDSKCHYTNNNRIATVFEAVKNDPNNNITEKKVARKLISDYYNGVNKLSESALVAIIISADLSNDGDDSDISKIKLLINDTSKHALFDNQYAIATNTAQRELLFKKDAAMFKLQNAMEAKFGQKGHDDLAKLLEYKPTELVESYEKIAEYEMIANQIKDLEYLLEELKILEIHENTSSNLYKKLDDLHLNDSNSDLNPQEKVKRLKDKFAQYTVDAFNSLRLIRVNIDSVKGFGVLKDELDAFIDKADPKLYQTAQAIYDAIKITADDTIFNAIKADTIKDMINNLPSSDDLSTMFKDLYTTMVESAKYYENMMIAGAIDFSNDLVKLKDQDTNEYYNKLFADYSSFNSQELTALTALTDEIQCFMKKDNLENSGLAKLNKAFELANSERIDETKVGFYYKNTLLIDELVQQAGDMRHDEDGAVLGAFHINTNGIETLKKELIAHFDKYIESKKTVLLKEAYIVNNALHAKIDEMTNVIWQIEGTKEPGGGEDHPILNIIKDEFTALSDTLSSEKTFDGVSNTIRSIVFNTTGDLKSVIDGSIDQLNINMINKVIANYKSITDSLKALETESVNHMKTANASTQLLDSATTSSALLYKSELEKMFADAKELYSDVANDISAPDGVKIEIGINLQNNFDALFKQVPSSIQINLEHMINGHYQNYFLNSNIHEYIVKNEKKTITEQKNAVQIKIDQLVVDRDALEILTNVVVKQAKIRSLSSVSNYINTEDADINKLAEEYEDAKEEFDATRTSIIITKQVTQ